MLFLLALRLTPAIISLQVRLWLCFCANKDRMSEKKEHFILLIAASVLITFCPDSANAIQTDQAQAFIGQDMHLSGEKLISYLKNNNEHILVFEKDFSLSIGASQFSSDKAVLWLKNEQFELRGTKFNTLSCQAYLEGSIKNKKNKPAKTTDITEQIIKPGQATFIRFTVTGEVFVTTDDKQQKDPAGSVLYSRAMKATKPLQSQYVQTPKFVLPKETAQQRKPAAIENKTDVAKKPAAVKAKQVIKKPIIVKEKGPEFIYPVNFAPLGKVKPQIETSKLPDDTQAITVIGRLYVWQKQDQTGRLLELQADNAVIFSSKQTEEKKEQSENLPAGSDISSIYLNGDVVITEGQRTIRADEVFYDFRRKKAIAINAVMRNFDAKRKIPIYLRAAKLQQLSQSKFSANNVTVTSSEFYEPQLCLTAADIIVTDTTAIDEQLDQLNDSSIDIQMKDVKINAYGKTIAHWPVMRSNMQRPDIPLKGIRIGSDSIWGTSVETRWHLSRLLGLREPEDTESTVNLDYFSDRGFGAGADVEYERENYFGKFNSYIINDHGEDELGRHSSRENLDPQQDLRGRIRFQHRHFLDYNWQLTTELNYASDENFLEQYYRGEFNTDKEPETLIHLKRLEDNWAVSILGKARLNNFSDKLEELPSFEFHLTGESLFDDMITLYSDTQISRFRQRVGDGHTTLMDQDEFSFAWQRVELDMPLLFRGQAGRSWIPSWLKVVPFVAGNFGYDDRSGFNRTLVDGTETGSFGDDKVFLGETGVRLATQFWKVYPNVKSQLWDLNKLRHIIEPKITAVTYTHSDSAIEQRDILNFGLSQRLQTKRPVKDKEQTVDWMRLDLDFTVVKDSSHDAGNTGPDRFMWNKPMVPPTVLSAPGIFNGDLANSLHRFENFGPRRNYFAADFLWRATDTTAVLSDLNYDTVSGVVQQFNIGFSRLVWPNLSYYIGSRYLRRVSVMDEEGSNAVTFAATYVLDPRYTIIFAQQFDFDYGTNMRSNITLIRQYQRMYWGLTFSADGSIDRRSVVFSIWPQGLPELALGQRRYMNVAQ